MPLSRYLLLLCAVIAAAGVTVALAYGSRGGAVAALVAPGSLALALLVRALPGRRP
ncbi:hypothetical protein [Defluviimonas sp. SAOS-178_SWC]|uniref:hypothetical protein n=1 Tax=Defluviimonas sp. SAOS-178_SWC TaxID=3121287 RepID=UPI003221C9EA